MPYAQPPPLNRSS